MGVYGLDQYVKASIRLEVDFKSASRKLFLDYGPLVNNTDSGL
jgi:hypothetical protein